MSSTGKFKGWRLTLGLIVIPMVLAVIYYGFFAADRFVSSAQVVVRQEGSNPGAQLPGLSMLLTGANPAKRLGSLRESWGLTNDDIAVIHVGRLAPEKNLGLLKRCFEHVQATYPQRRMKLIVVGDGPQRAALEKAMPEAIFCGAQRGEALACHYASGDVFVFPSLTETFGNVVLEALASGLGVVAYDQAAAAQHIRQGYNGVLAMPGDEEAFCDVAAWLLEEAETLRCIRLNARQHASRQGWGAIIEQFEGQLRGACKIPAPQANAAPLKPASSTPHD